MTQTVLKASEKPRCDKASSRNAVSICRIFEKIWISQTDHNNRWLKRNVPGRQSDKSLDKKHTSTNKNTLLQNQKLKMRLLVAARVKENQNLHTCLLQRVLHLLTSQPTIYLKLPQRPTSPAPLISSSACSVFSWRVGASRRPHPTPSVERAACLPWPQSSSTLALLSFSPHSLHLPNPILYSFLPFLHLSFCLPTPNLTLSLSSTITYSFHEHIFGNMCWQIAEEEVERKRKMERVEMRKYKALPLNETWRSPRLVSAPHHGSGFLLAPLVIHRVHKLKDVCRTKLECGAWTQHRRLSNSLPIDEHVCVRAVRRHRHHAVGVHEVAVVRQDPRTQQLNGNVSASKAAAFTTNRN